MNFVIDYLKKFLNDFLNIIIPNKCPVCEKLNFDGYFCSDCWKKLKFINNFCVVCGRPLPKQSKSQVMICPKRPEKNCYYDKIVSVFIYNRILSKSIFEFKYHKKTFLCRLFSKLLLIAYKKINKNVLDYNSGMGFLDETEKITIDYVLPVPMYIKKLRKRGYNQSLLLVREFSKLTKIPYFSDLLIKSINTISQTKLSYTERKKNLKLAFIFNNKYKEEIKNKNILIIDDVITTGTTINECAKVLKENGAKGVFAISIGRGIGMSV